MERQLLAQSLLVSSSLQGLEMTSASSRTQMGSRASPELHARQQLSGECTPVEKSAHSWPLSFPPPALPLQAEPGGARVERCSFMPAFPLLF